MFYIFPGAQDEAGEARREINAGIAGWQSGSGIREKYSEPVANRSRGIYTNPFVEATRRDVSAAPRRRNCLQLGGNDKPAGEEWARWQKEKPTAKETDERRRFSVAGEKIDLAQPLGDRTLPPPGARNQIFKRVASRAPSESVEIALQDRF